MPIPDMENKMSEADVMWLVAGGFFGLLFLHALYLLHKGETK